MFILQNTGTSGKTYNYTSGTLSKTFIGYHETYTVKLITFIFKVGISFLKCIFVCFNENSLKMMKSAFYFILKALFVLKIFTFLS